ncbi:hypothetical protein QJQ45_000528 [Haematococcus lacustris]|nr:hypothetical protein QJQ45_000528 [Haematococcus lacustris]
MVGSIEYAIAEDRLDIDGQLWEAKEADPTEGRECSAPFRMTPWAGKYHVPPTPPNGVVLQKVLAGMNDRGVGLLVLEVDAAAAARGTYDWVRPNVAVHTWLPAPPQGIAATAEAMQAYEALKDAALLPFRELEDVNTQLAIVNLDDPLSPELLELSKLVVSVTYAIDNTEADVVAESMKSDIWENEVIVRTPLGRLQIITPLLGKHNTYNILAAVATGIALELPLKSIVAGIEAVEVVPGRCEVIDEGQNFSVIVDRADNPKALEAMLTALKGSAENILTVVGCRGDEDSSQRPYMADTAHHLSDLVIFTNDSPRTEPPEAIVQDQGHVPLWFEPYLQKAQRTTKRYVMEDRFSAIRAAIGSAGPGDVVLIAGRGHQDFMEYGTEEVGGAHSKDTVVRAWFDDRAEARSALSKLAYLNQLTKLKRTHLPWGNALDEMDTLFDPPIDPDEEEQEEEKRTRKKPAAAAASN